MHILPLYMENIHHNIIDEENVLLTNFRLDMEDHPGLIAFCGSPTSIGVLADGKHHADPRSNALVCTNKR